MTETTETALLDWPTIPAAAARLGVSERTLERRIAAGEIETRGRRRPGKRPETVCQPGDIARLMPPAHVASNKTALQPAQRPEMDGWRMMTAVAALSSRRTGKSWLTLKEARDTSGLSVRLLRRLISAGEVQAIRDGAWKIDRASLEAWQPIGLSGSFDNTAARPALAAGSGT
jgi:hypothetical protein